jgi:hypothetical protein
MNSNAFKMRAILYGPNIAGTNAPDDYSNAPFTIANASTPVPTATLSAKPTTIIAGSSTTLTWSSTNAVSCAGTSAGSSWTANGSVTNLSAAGSQVITPINNPGLLPYAIVYNITCTGPGGTSTPASATVTVNAAPVVSTPQLSVSPTSITLGSANPTATVTVTNTGAAASTLSWVLAGYPGGLSVSPQGGTLSSGKSQQVTFTYSSSTTPTGNMPDSLYFYPVSGISGSGNNGTPVVVSLTVTAPPIIAAPPIIITKPISPKIIAPLQTSASDTSNQTAIVAQSLQSLLNQLSVLLKSL